MKIIMTSMDVKKLLTIAVLSCIVQFGLAQKGMNSTKNTFTLEGGVGGSGYKWQTNQNFGSTVAVSWDYNIMAGFFFHNRVNVNLEYERHMYVTGEQDSAEFDIDFVGSNRLGIGLRYAIVDNPKYQLLLGGTVGGFNFRYSISDSVTTASFKANGIYQTYGITNKFLFGEQRKLGLFLKLGIVNNPMGIREIKINDEVKEVFQGRQVDAYKYVSLGYYLKFGLTFNLSGSPK